MSQPRVALVHDWLTGMRGGEYVLEGLTELFETPELFTLIHVQGSVSPAIEKLPIRASFLQKIPGIAQSYRKFLGIMPSAAERLDVSGADLVVSSSHCVAKGVRKRPDAVHVSFVHAPMRYMWDRFDDYFGPGKASPLVRAAARFLRPRLREWDRRVSQTDRVDALVANSSFIAEQIRAAYGRDAGVVHPFADLSRFGAARAPEPFYLMVGAFAPYKRVDLAIEAFNRLGLPLRIVGGGQEADALRRLAGPTIEFLGQVSNEEIASLYRRCRAFVFPGVEDFGITPLEAMASGAPVIAFAAGGALDTVTRESGVLFKPQTVDALCEAVIAVERLAQAGAVHGRAGQALDERAIRAQAAGFTRAEFQKRFLVILRETWARRGKDPAALEALLAPRFRSGAATLF